VRTNISATERGARGGQSVAMHESVGGPKLASALDAAASANGCDADQIGWPVPRPVEPIAKSAHSKWTASQTVGCRGSVHSTRWRFLAGMKT
jgi:hypothetical protein